MIFNTRFHLAVIVALSLALAAVSSRTSTTIAAPASRPHAAGGSLTLDGPAVKVFDRNGVAYNVELREDSLDLCEEGCTGNVYFDARNMLGQLVESMGANSFWNSSLEFAFLPGVVAHAGDQGFSVYYDKANETAAERAAQQAVPKYLRIASGSLQEYWSPDTNNPVIIDGVYIRLGPGSWEIFNQQGQWVYVACPGGGKAWVYAYWL